MEYLLFVLLLITFIILITIKNNFSSQLLLLQRKMDDLSKEIKRLQQPVIVKSQEQLDVVEKPVAHTAPVITPFVEEKKEVEKPIGQVALPTPPQEEPIPVAVPLKEEVGKEKEEEVLPPIELNPPRVTPPLPPRKPGFFERNPDLEKFIGENLANKIGIGILVLGIGFFVKYAIDQEWINEIGRVFIGIACGGILIGVAHRMRKTFAAFSSVLVGGGIAVLYFTIAIAFREYSIFSQTAAFILMVIITGFTIVLSLAYNRIELAVIGILGGFASPFMVSTGEGNYAVLFTYILILDVGMLVLAYYKKWNLVNIIAYIFTLILFGSWLGAQYDSTNVAMMRGGIVFATLFYLVFFAMNIINNIRNRVTFRSIEITLLLSNTFCYYAAGMYLLDNPSGENFKGLFTAALGIFNFIFAYSLYKNERVDRNLVFLLIGLVLTFISLAAPVQLEGNYITLFWAAEAVLLLWLSQKSGIRLMKLASILVMALMIISLLMDWEQLYFDGTTELTVIINKAYITSIAVLLSIAGTLHFLKFEADEYQQYVKPYRLLLNLGGILLLYASQFLELQYQLPRFVDDFTAVVIIIGCYNLLFITVLLLAESRLGLPEQVRKAFAGWGVIAILSFLLFYHGQTIEARDNYLLGNATFTGFGFHYVYIAFLLVISIITLKRVQQLTHFNETSYNAYSWFYVSFFVFLASAELDHTVLLIGFSDAESMDHILTQNHKIGFPILWGIASFLLIAIGLKMKKKHLRIVSLTLLLITLVKLFVVDIRGISEGGKIAAFISLGILLLVVSFMYQRLKKILLADEPVQSNDQTEEK